MEYLKGILASLVGLLAPIHAVMFAVLVLIFADLIFGLWAAKKNKTKITSSGLRRTVTKIFVYEFVIICGFLFQNYLLGVPGDWVVKLIASLIGIVEFKSILEKANSILGENIFKLVIVKLGSDNDKMNSPDDKK